MSPHPSLLALSQVHHPSLISPILESLLHTLPLVTPLPHPLTSPAHIPHPYLTSPHRLTLSRLLNQSLVPTPVETFAAIQPCVCAWTSSHWSLPLLPWPARLFPAADRCFLQLHAAGEDGDLCSSPQYGPYIPASPALCTWNESTIRQNSGLGTTNVSNT